MARSRIEKNDILDFDGLNKGFDQAIEKLGKLVAGFKELLQTDRDLIAVNNFQNSGDIEKFNTTVDRSNKLLKSNIDAEIKLERLKQQRIKTLEAERKATERVRREQAKLNGEYEKGKARLNEVKKELKELEFTGRTNGKLYKALRQEFEQLDPKVRKAEVSVGEFNRFVGGYTGGIKDAIRETGQFSTGLQRLEIIQNILQQSFGNTVKSIKTATTATKIFNGVLKAAGIGLILTAVGSLTAFFTKFEEGQDIIQRFFAQVSAGFTVFINRLAKLGGGIKDLVSGIFSFDKSQITSGLDQITNSFKGMGDEISKTAQAAGKLFDEIDAFQQVIRQLTLQIAFLNKEEQKLNTLVNDNTLSFKERERVEVRLAKVAERRLKDELLLAEKEFEFTKRKLANDANITAQELDNILKTQEARGAVTDERLNDLIEIQKKVIEAETNITNEEEKQAQNRRFNRQKETLNNLRIIEETYQTEINTSKKAAAEIKDAFEEREKALSDFSLKSAEAFEKEIEQLQETTKIQIDSTLLLIAENSVVLEERIRNLELADKLEDQLIKAIGRRKQAIQDAADLEKKIREDQKKAEEDANIKRVATNAYYIKRKQEQDKKDDDLAEDRRKKEVDETFKLVDQVTDAITQGLDERNEKIEKQLDREISAREAAIEKQRSLAERGLANQLAFEEQKLAESELRKREQEEREQRQKEAIQLAETYLNYLNQYVKENPQTAHAKAFAETIAARAVTKLIAGAFAEGVEDFKGKGTGTSDSNLIWFSNGESVVTANGTQENPGLTTAMNEGVVREYFEKVYLPDYAIDPGINKSTGERMGSNIMLNVLVKEMKELKQAFNNRPEHITQLDNWGNVVETIVSNGVKKVITHKNRRGRI